MGIEFDPAKDAANIAKHGMSLADFAGFDAQPVLVVDDRMDYGETRYRAFGRIDGEGHCIVYTVAGTDMRLISFRRAHDKEMRRYERQDQGKFPAAADDNPEWTAEDFARAKPASEVHGKEIAAMLVRKRGRPAGSTSEKRKEQIALRVDREVINTFKEEGPRWQSRMNEALWPRVEVQFATALKGWTVTVIRPAKGGRSHHILRKLDDLEDAKTLAEKTARQIERREGVRPRVTVYPKRSSPVAPAAGA